MPNQFDTTPRLLHPHLWDGTMPQPGFSINNLNNLTEIMANSLPGTRFILVGYLAESDSLMLTSDTTVQKLDIDFFMPVIKTSSERWSELAQDGFIGDNPSILRCGSFTYISPELSNSSNDEIKETVARSLSRHLPPEHIYNHQGRTGEPLTIIGENVSIWGENRRQQTVGMEKPYLEIVPLVIDDEDTYLDEQLAKIGISPDLSPRYCSFYQGQYSPLDLHLHRAEIKRWGIYGLPDLNWDYINDSPNNGLHWIRREIKALSLYKQLYPDVLAEQQIIFLDHVNQIIHHHPSLLDNQVYIHKINTYLGELNLSQTSVFPVPASH